MKTKNIMWASLCLVLVLVGTVVLVKSYSTSSSNDAVEMYEAQTAYATWPAPATTVYAGFSLDPSTLTTLSGIVVDSEGYRLVVPLCVPNTNSELVVVEFDNLVDPIVPSAGYTGLGDGVLKTCKLHWGGVPANRVRLEVLVADSEAAAAGALLGMPMRRLGRTSRATGMSGLQKNTVSGLGTVNLRFEEETTGALSSSSMLGFYRKNVFVSLEATGAGSPDLVSLAQEIDALLLAETAVTPAARDSLRPSANLSPTTTTLCDTPSVAPTSTSVSVATFDPNSTPIVATIHQWDEDALWVDDSANPTEVSMVHTYGTTDFVSYAINENLLWGQGSVVFDVVAASFAPRIEQTFVSGAGTSYEKQGVDALYAGESKVSLELSMTHEIEIVDGSGIRLFYDSAVTKSRYDRPFVSLNRSPISGEVLTINDLTNGLSTSYTVLEPVQKISSLSAGTISRATGSVVTVHGQNFSPTSEFRLTQSGAGRLALVVTYISSAEVQVAIPALAAPWADGNADLEVWDYSSNSNMGWQHDLDLAP